MIEKNTIGNSANSPYCAYGDDSRYSNIILYAFGFFQRRHVNRAKKVLSRIKYNYNLSEDFKLHCRILFNESAKQKAGIAHVNQEKIENMLFELIDSMNKVPFTLRYSYCFAEQLTELSMVKDENIQIHDEPKGLQGLLTQSCFAVTKNGNHGPSANECQIFISRDSTKVNFLGRGRRQAHFWASGYSDINTSKDEEPHFIEPIIIDVKDEPLLEFADVLSYTCAHAIANKGNHKYFKKLLSKIKYKSNSMLSLNYPK